MHWQYKRAALVAVTALIALNGDALVAQGLFSGNRYDSYYPPRYYFQMTLARIAMMAASIGCGFAIGWFLSPHAKGLRRMVLLGLGVLALTIAIFNHGLLGWGTAWLVSFVGFCAAFGYWAGRGVKAMMETPTTFGSSRWADLDHMDDKGLFGRDGIILGSVTDEDGDEEVFSYKGDRHLLTVAPTRSGKGVSHIIVNLLNYDGSALVIDPKGENAMITAQARSDMGQQVHCVDPWHVRRHIKWDIRAA